MYVLNFFIKVSRINYFIFQTPSLNELLYLVKKKEGFACSSQGIGGIHFYIQYQHTEIMQWNIDIPCVYYNTKKGQGNFK